MDQLDQSTVGRPYIYIYICGGTIYVYTTCQLNSFPTGYDIWSLLRWEPGLWTLERACNARQYGSSSCLFFRRNLLAWTRSIRQPVVVSKWMGEVDRCHTYAIISLIGVDRHATQIRKKSRRATRDLIDPPTTAFPRARQRIKTTGRPAEPAGSPGHRTSSTLPAARLPCLWALAAACSYNAMNTMWALFSPPTRRRRLLYVERLPLFILLTSEFSFGSFRFRARGVHWW